MLVQKDCCYVNVAVVELLLLLLLLLCTIYMKYTVWYTSYR